MFIGSLIRRLPFLRRAHLEQTSSLEVNTGESQDLLHLSTFEQQKGLPCGIGASRSHLANDVCEISDGACRPHSWGSRPSPSLFRIPLLPIFKLCWVYILAPYSRPNTNRTCVYTGRWMRHFNVATTGIRDAIIDHGMLSDLHLVYAILYMDL